MTFKGDADGEFGLTRRMQSPKDAPPSIVSHRWNPSAMMIAKSARPW